MALNPQPVNHFVQLQRYKYNAKKGNSADQGQLTRALAILCTFGHPTACSVLLKCCTVLLSSAEYCPVLPVLPVLLKKKTMP